jgi:hypothetical protein
MILTHLLPLLLTVGAVSAVQPPPTTEETGFADLLPYSNQDVLILSVGAEPKDVRCEEGRLLDWAAYHYQFPDDFYRYTPADRWRCVKRIDWDTHRNTRHYSPKQGVPSPPLPASASTGFYSNLDAETYKLFKKRIAMSGTYGFAWKVSD